LGVKSISRGSAAADAESYRPELVGDEEPRYLRRQKPVEIRRKKFGGRSWPFYRRVLFCGVVGIAGISAAWTAGRFLLYGHRMLLVKPEQIEVNGNHIVSREAVLQQFVRDRGRSVLRIPLDSRRSALEEISWIESAMVQRILPNRIRVDLTERTPIAFLRNGTELALIDARGVILDRPHGEDLQFPIVTGLSENMPREERGKRMQTYQEFLKDIDLVRSGSSDRVSEIDLSNPKDLRAVMTGISMPPIRRRSQSISAPPISPANIAWSLKILRSGRPATAGSTPSICNTRSKWCSTRIPAPLPRQE